MRVYNHRAGREQDIKNVLLCNANGYDYRRSAAGYISDLESLLRDIEHTLKHANMESQSRGTELQIELYLGKINALLT